MDAYNLTARLTLDTSEYDEALGRVRSDLPALRENVEETEKKVGGMGDKLGAAFGAAAKAIGAATAAAAAGAAALVKQSVDAYKNYEQLVGGVETLFSNLEGTVSAAPAVLENAKNAYKTAGMSANEYMETVTSFSAALVSSLGNDYQKAAEISDMAIRDMSDNANKMGTSMEAIQNAYQGFSKQNYTMLDNLKLGYGGTKSEMERLLADAEKFSGFKYDISSLSDVYEAIHVIQQEMGIAGTTAKEANDTISGSMGQLSGAWSNLVAGFADAQADIPKLINDVVEVAEVSFGNMLPVVEQSISGLAEFVEDIAPVITSRLPALAEELIPPVINTANTVVDALIETLPSILSSVTEVAPEAITEFTKTAIDLLPQVADLGVDLIISLADGITDSLPELIPAAKDAVVEISDALTDPENIEKLISSGAELIMAMLDGVIKALPDLVNAGLNAAGNLIEATTGLSEFADFIREQEEVVGLATAAFVTYKSAVAISSTLDTVITSVSSLTGALSAQITALAGATAGQTALNIAMAAAPYALVAVAVGAVALELGYYYDKVFNVSDAVEDLQKEQEILYNKIDSGISTIKDEAAALKEDVDRYNELKNAAELTYDEEYELINLASELQTAFGDKVNVIDELTGEYNDLTDAVYDYIDAEARAKEIAELEQAKLDLSGNLVAYDQQLADRATQHQQAVSGFNILDWNHQTETTNFLNDQAATRALKEEDQAKLDEVTERLDFLYGYERGEEENARQGAASKDYYTSHYMQKDLAGEGIAGLAAKGAEDAKNAVDEILSDTSDFETKAIGEYTNLGVKQVLGHTFDDAEKEADAIASTVYKASDVFVDRLIKQQGIGFDDQIAWWAKIRDQFVEGSEQWNKANDEIYAAQKKQSEQAAKEQAAAEKESAQNLKDYYNERSDTISRSIKREGKTLEEQIELWEDFRDEFAEGSDYYNKIDDTIFDLQQKQRDEAEKQRAADEKAAEEASKKADAEIKEKYNNSVEEIRRRTKLEELSLSQQIELWENLQKEFDESSEYYNKIEEKLFDLNKAQEAENLKEQEEAAKKAAETIKDIYDKGIEDIRLATKYNDLSYDEQIALWEELLKQFEEGSDYYNKIVEKIFDLNEARKKEEAAAAAQEAAEEEKREKERTAALQKQYNERLKLIAEYDEQIDALNKANEAAQKSYDDALESRTKAIEQSYKLFDKVPERTLYSGIDLRTNLEGQVNNIKEFYSNLDTLTARGVGDELIAELRSMGVGALDQVEALVALSDDELSKYTAVYDEKAALSKAIAEEELSGLKAETEDIINKNLDDIEDLTKKRSEEIGLSVVEGIALGISENANLIIGALDGAFVAMEEVGVATKSMSPSEKSSKFGSTNNNNITVNINGGEYNDIEKLATEVGDVIEFRLARLQAGYSATEMDMA